MTYQKYINYGRRQENMHQYAWVSVRLKHNEITERIFFKRSPPI